MGRCNRLASLRMLLLCVSAALLLSCRMVVPLEDVYGVYLLEYPIGSEMVTLRRDGTFTQEVRLANRPPVTVTGTGSFDRVESILTWHGHLEVVDEFGDLEPEWRRPQRDGRNSVEMLWFRVEIGSGGTFPYVKQGGLD